MINSQEQFKYQQLSKKSLHNIFYRACATNELELVEYLLTNKDLKHQVDIHGHDDLAFKCSCAQGSLDVIKFLLTSPDLTERIDLNARSGDGVINACHEGQLEVMKYFIFTHHLEYSEGIKTVLNYNHYNEIIKLFEIRELNEKLEINLIGKCDNFKKIKI